MCESLYSRIGLASQGKPHMLQNCCMKIYFDFTNLCTDLESTPRAPLWRKMSFILGILNDLFTSKLHLSLPATTRGPLCASYCVQESPWLVKVSHICFKISVSKYALISQNFVPIWKVHKGLLGGQKLASYWENLMTYSLANFIFLSQLLPEVGYVRVIVYKNSPR